MFQLFLFFITYFLSYASLSSVETRYQIELLTMQPYEHSFAFKINDNGLVIGRLFKRNFSLGAFLTEEAFIWNSTDGMQIIEPVFDLDQFDSEGLLLEFLGNINNSYIRFINLNAKNQIVGYINDLTQSKVDAMILDEYLTVHRIPIEVQDLKSSLLISINSQSTALGSCVLSNKESYAFIAKFNSNEFNHPISFIPFDSKQFQPKQLNNSNHLVGIAGLSDQTLMFFDLETDKHFLFPLNETILSFVLNDQDLVVGIVKDKFFVWYPLENRFLEYPFQSPWPHAELVELTAINEAGQVVGYARSTQNREELYPFIWDAKQGIKDLNQLLNLPSGLTLSIANGLNNQGQIVGSAKKNNQYIGFILTPCQSEQPD